ncbi:protein artichoke isoform X2 [Prorops nasuta]|uniref:protein artichoke isoform X2 n=1 Tax=Prorops nasuta TaxID=863751 RepID=UPI0034CF1D38
MVRSLEGGGLLIVLWYLVLQLVGTNGQLGPEYGCPPQDKILPCRCSTRDMEFQIWCSHSELPKVLEGLNAVSHYVTRPVDELILENNNLPSLPGKVFTSLRVLRLMLRNNRLERVSSGWLEGLHDSLLELFIVEPELRSLPIDSLENLQGLEAVTLQSKVMKRLPRFSGLPKLRYLQINSPALLELAPRNFRELPNLEQLHVFGSPRLTRLEAGVLRSLPRLNLVNVSDCGVHWIHPRAMIDLPELKELSLVGNSFIDAGLVGRACVDLPALSIVKLDRNRINRLAEATFVDLPMLSKLYLSRNQITEVFPGAFQRVPMLKTLDLNHNMVHRIHPDFSSRRMGSGLEEMWLINNDLSHVAELRSVLESLPRLKFLDASHNQLEEIPFGALRGHPTLERLHLDHNRLAFLQRESFTAMPALRELRLSNNSLSNLLEAPFWNLPALKGLDLSGNYFRHVEPRLLANLPNLRRLDLSGNAIGLIEPDSFVNTPALEHVNVSGNALSVLHPMTFRHLMNLYELDIGWNRMLELVPGLPKNIEHLHMSMNRIVALPSVTSQDLALPVLRTLDISANGIERIPPGTLNDLPTLRKLNLGYNALRILEDGTFDGLGRLEQLDLKYNRLVTLHGRSFRPLRSLMDLNLRGNRLEVIRPDIFQENSRLQRLDISRNNLAQIPHSCFMNTRDLRELYASHNTLTELPGSLHGLTALQVLDLSFNKLNILSPETLSSLSSLLELKLVRNRIRELREGAFDRLPRLTLIDLENNDLRVIERNAIRALPELQAVRLGKNKLQSIPSGAFTELPLLQSAELQENRIHEIANNAFINVPHLLFLNLSNNNLAGLEYVGLDSLRSLEVLDLSNNRLSRVSSDSLAAMEWLVELKMDNNRICAIHGSPFDDMPRLRVLSLRSNKMASVSETAFKRLRSNIAILDIDGNPLSCSCGMLWLRGWLQQSSAEGPRCADGSLFKEIRLSRQDCQRDIQAEPIPPGCEAEMINAISPASSNVPELNVSEMTKVQTGDQQSKPQSTVKNSTSPVKKNGVPPSPSSSGFTFFGVPLPSLNFNLWGNSGRKAERKDDPVTGRSNQGRYKNFPLTEPEIHRGGFVPLPRGQGGFLPIPDPRLAHAKETQISESQNLTALRMTEERKHWKSSNATVAKVEKTFLRNTKPKTALRERDELSNISISKNHSFPTGTVTRKFSTNNTKISIYIPQNATSTDEVEEVSQETVEALVSTEIYSGESLEISVDIPKVGDKSQETASKIVWTTPNSMTSETNRNDKDGRITTNYPWSNKEKEEVTTVNTKDGLKPDENIHGTTPELPYYLTQSIGRQKLEDKYLISSTERATEASALSALLIPGGQVTSLPSSSRPLGRSTITKVPSPHIGNAERAAQKSSESQESKNRKDDGNAKVMDDNAFNWYFQHYNDSDLEPFVGVSYGKTTNIGISQFMFTAIQIFFVWYNI